MDIMKIDPYQLIEGVTFLAEQVRASGKRYDAVVAPSRGGLVPGVAMSHALNLPFFPLIYSTRDFPSTRDPIPSQLVDCLQTLTHPTRVLLVEDIVDTGTSVKALKYYLKSIPTDVDVASIVTNEKQPVDVQYKYITIDQEENPCWTEFFYEVPEKYI